MSAAKKYISKAGWKPEEIQKEDFRFWRSMTGHAWRICRLSWIIRYAITRMKSSTYFLDHRLKSKAPWSFLPGASRILSWGQKMSLYWESEMSTLTHCRNRESPSKDSGRSHIYEPEQILSARLQEFVTHWVSPPTNFFRNEIFTTWTRRSLLQMTVKVRVSYFVSHP